MADSDPTEPHAQPLASGTTAIGQVATSSTYPLPSGEFPFETHLDVLRRFMSVSRNGADPVEPAAVEGHGLPPNAAQQNAAFLGSIGLLVEEKAGRFKPTAVAMQFINTQIADDGRGRRLLRSLIAKTWFAVVARTLVAPERGVPLEDEELLAALAAAAHAPADRPDGALRVLIEYLAYTGILVRPDRGVSRESEKPPQTAASASFLHRTTTPIPAAARTEAPPQLGAGTPKEAEPWEVIQTSEFYLKIQPKPAVVKRLRKQLDLLDQKLRETGKRGPNR